MTAENEPTTEMRELPVAQIAPDPNQPRKVYDAQELLKLAASIRKDGLIEPLVVRPTFGKWTLIAGERRWRACQLAGVERVPVVIKEVTAERAFELALIENKLREHLPPMDEAEAFGKLLAGGKSLAEIASIVEENVAYVEFRLRLLQLRPEYQDAVRRKILPLPQAADLARVPANRQLGIFRMYVAGKDPNDVARLITALIEVDRQPELPVVQDVEAAGDRFGRVLKRMASLLGGCYSKKSLELLGWALSAHADRNLILVDLLIKQLGQVKEALRKAQARKSARQPTRDSDARE